MKWTFHYSSTHKHDEAYMQEMCAQGWATVRLVEGFWRFEECQPGQYCYRIAYLRGLKKPAMEELKRQYAAQGISFVSRYSFWAIFRSQKPFVLYSLEQEQEIFRKIYAPMPIAATVAGLLFMVGFFLAKTVSGYFWILTIVAGLYGSMCTWLAQAYHKLLQKQI